MTTSLQAIADSAASEHALVEVFRADGVPSNAGRPFQLLPSGSNSYTQKQEDNRNVQTLTSTLASARAKHAEANQLGALAIAGAWLGAGNGSKVLVIVDSGLQTVAPLRFEDGLLGAATRPKDIAAQVAHDNALPNLSNVDVTWIGLGQTSAPQATLPTAQARKEQAIWQAILDRAHAKLIWEPEELADNPQVLRLPPVTPVPIVNQRSIAGRNCGVTTLITWHDVQFRGNNWTYAFPARARSSIRKLAIQLRSHKCLHIKLRGMTANVGSFAGQLVTAMKRTLVIEHQLITDGIPKHAFEKPQALGSHFPGHVNEYRPNGTLDEALAAQNRFVSVTAR